MPQADMAWDTFKTIVDGITEVGATVSLQGEGEPSLHPLFEEMARYVLRKGHVPYTILNGTRLDALTLAALFPRVGISIDTLDEARANEIGRHNISKVLRQLDALLLVMPPGLVTVMTVDMGQPLDVLRAWVRTRGFGRHIIQPLSPKTDYARRYTVSAEGLRRHGPSYCGYLERGLMRFYTWSGQELPCCFMKDGSEFGSIAKLRAALRAGVPTRSCAACPRLKSIQNA